MAQTYSKRKKCSIKVYGVIIYWMDAAQGVHLYLLVPGRKIYVRFVLQAINVTDSGTIATDPEESQRLQFGGVLTRQNLRVCCAEELQLKI